MLLLYALVIGLILGLAAGGRLSGLASVRLSLWPVALGGLLFQVVLFSSPLASVVGPLGPSLYVVSTTVVLMALVVNYRQPGFPLIVTGALLNLAVIMLNGGQMPASPDAVAALLGQPVVPGTGFTNSVIADPSTPLWFLGDIFVLPRPLPLANVFSIGDVLIGVGGAWWLAATMRTPVPPRARRVALRG